MKWTLILLAALMKISAASATNGIVALGYATGGRQLSDVEPAGGGYSLHAGEGLYLGLGAELPVVGGTAALDHFDLRFEGGVMFSSDHGAEDKSGHYANNVDWIRLPLSALYFYSNRAWRARAGWGLTYQVGNSINGSGARNGASADVKDALGWVAAFEKDLIGTVALGLRYTWINYKSNAFTERVRGDNLMVTFSFAGPL